MSHEHETHRECSEDTQSWYQVQPPSVPAPKIQHAGHPRPPLLFVWLPPLFQSPYSALARRTAGVGYSGHKCRALLIICQSKIALVHWSVPMRRPQERDWAHDLGGLSHSQPRCSGHLHSVCRWLRSKCGIQECGPRSTCTQSGESPFCRN